MGAAAGVINCLRCLRKRSTLCGLPEFPPEGFKMPASVSTAKMSRPLLLVALLAGVMFAATLGLWAYYGTAIFFEMVRAGWIACF